jgi:hypothetical protein
MGTGRYIPFRGTRLAAIAVAAALQFCGGTLYDRCEDQQRDARVCSALVLQYGVIAAEARRQSQNNQQSDLLIDGLPVAAGVILCQENISARCDAFLDD